MPNRVVFVSNSAEGSCERDGAFRSLVAVLHLCTNRLPHRVYLPCSQGLPVPLGARPWPQLRLPRPPRGSDIPPNRRGGRRARLGPQWESPGGGSLHFGPPVAGTLEPQTQGLPGTGQEGPLPSEVSNQPPQGAHEGPDGVHPPSPADWETHRATLCENRWASDHSGAAHALKQRWWRHSHTDATLFFYYYYHHYSWSGVFDSKSWMRTKKYNKNTKKPGLTLRLSGRRAGTLRGNCVFWTENKRIHLIVFREHRRTSAHRKHTTVSSRGGCCVFSDDRLSNIPPTVIMWHKY